MNEPPNKNSSNETCPWWLCWTMDNAIRKLFENPYKVMKSYIVEGNTVIDYGCGMGFFALPVEIVIQYQRYFLLYRGVPSVRT